MKKILLLIFLYNISTTLIAQDDGLTVSPTENEVITDENESLANYNATIDIDIRAAFTTGQFKQTYPKDGMMGAGFTVLFSIINSIPIDFGFGLGYYFMSETQNNYGYYTPGIGDYDVDIRVSGSMIPFHAVGRLYPLKSLNFPIQPYIEGLAGFRLFKVTQRLSTHIVSTDEYLPPEKTSDLTGSWSYGFGGGVKVRMSKKEQLFLNFKVDQLYGTETNYMDPSTVIIYADGTYEYSNQRSETDVLRFSIGLNIIIQ